MSALNDILAAMSAFGMLGPLQVLVVVGVAVTIYKFWVSRS